MPGERLEGAIDYLATMSISKAVLTSIILGSCASAITNSYNNGAGVVAFAGASSFYLACLNMRSGPEFLGSIGASGLTAAASLIFKPILQSASHDSLGPSLNELAAAGATLGVFIYFLQRQLTRKDEKYPTYLYFILSTIVSTLCISIAGMKMFDLALKGSSKQNLILNLAKANATSWGVSTALAGAFFITFGISLIFANSDFLKFNYIVNEIFKNIFMLSSSMIPGLIIFLELSNISYSDELISTIGISFLPLIFLIAAFKANKIREHFIHVGLKITDQKDQCSLLTMENIPTNFMDRIETQFAYVRLNEKLYFVVEENKLKVINVSLTEDKLREFDQRFKPGALRILTKEELESIDQIVGNLVNIRYFTRYRLQILAQQGQIISNQAMIARIKSCLCLSNSPSSPNSILTKVKALVNWTLPRANFFKDVFGEGLDLMGALTLTISLAGFLAADKEQTLKNSAQLGIILGLVELTGSLHGYLPISHQKGFLKLLTYGMFLAGEATKLARTYLITGMYLWFQYNQSRQLSSEEIDRGRAGVLGTMAALILQEAYFAHHIRKTVEKEHLSIVNTEQVNFGRRVVGRLMCSSSAQQSLQLPPQEIIKTPPRHPIQLPW